jgi:two-component system, chemotaxis family, sensor histidine kinase and response regulator PixL
MNDSQIQAQAYSYFLSEAPELLETIEQEILTLPSERTTAKVHNLMRALHTLKGAAANVGLSTMEWIAHEFEDVARVFYDLEIEIDVAVQSLLLEGYAGLQECLQAQIVDRPIDESAVAERIATTLEQLKLKLGDWSEADIALPTAMELGFDIVASIFETTVQEQIDTLAGVIATHDPAQLVECLESIAEVGIGLAESFELPGFLAIDRAILAAIANHPERIGPIADLALENLRQAQAQVLAGDRTSGGTVLPALAELAGDRDLAVETLEQLDPAESLVGDLPSAIEISFEESIAQLAPELSVADDLFPQVISNQNLTVAAGEAELPAFQAFLASDRFHKRHPISNDTQHLFDRIVRLCWDWFRHEIRTPDRQLNFEVLVTAEGLADLDYIHHWIELMLKGVSTPSDRQSLQLYRQCCVYQVIFATTKYLAEIEPLHQITPEFLTDLRLHLQALANEYQQHPPITANERGWIDRIILPHHWTQNSVTSIEEDRLLNEIWGQPNLGQIADEQ